MSERGGRAAACPPPFDRVHHARRRKALRRVAQQRDQVTGLLPREQHAIERHEVRSQKRVLNDAHDWPIRLWRDDLLAHHHDRRRARSPRDSGAWRFISSPSKSAL